MVRGAGLDRVVDPDVVADADRGVGALDDRAGPNFQILVNAIYFAAFGAP